MDGSTNIWTGRISVVHPSVPRHILGVLLASQTVAACLYLTLDWSQIQLQQVSQVFRLAMSMIIRHQLL